MGGVRADEPAYVTVEPGSHLQWYNFLPPWRMAPPEQAGVLGRRLRRGRPARKRSVTLGIRPRRGRPETVQRKWELVQGNWEPVQIASARIQEPAIGREVLRNRDRRRAEEDPFVGGHRMEVLVMTGMEVTAEVAGIAISARIQRTTATRKM